MKANELRIGNYVMNKYFMFKVAEISHNVIKGFSTLGGPDVYPDTIYSLGINNLSGVELDKEWFIKLGFKFDGVMFDIDDKFRIGDYKSGYHLVNGFNLLDKVIEVKYVHQLQNLYYALTGTELTIV